MKYLSIDNRRKPIFKELIENWDSTLRVFENVMTVEDLPYVYKERTNIGFLAAAATKMGFIALEEYTTEKLKKTGSKNGRADLWLYNKNNSLDMNIEAKFKEVSWNSTRVVETVKPVLNKALDDVKEVYLSERPSYALGIVFIRPYNANPINFNPNKFWNQLSNRSSVGGDFCALHLCEKKIWSQQISNKGYPGIGIVGKFYSE